MSSRKVADAHVQFTTKGLDSVKRDISEAASQLRALGRSVSGENLLKQMQSNLNLGAGFRNDISKMVELQKNLRVAIALKKDLDKKSPTDIYQSSRTVQAGIAADRQGQVNIARRRSEHAIAGRQGDALAASPALRSATATAVKQSLTALKSDRDSIAKMIASSSTLSPAFKAKTAGVSSLNIQSSASAFQMRDEAQRIRDMIDSVKNFGRAGTKTAAEVNEFREEMEKLARSLELAAIQADSVTEAQARAKSIGVQGQGALRGSLRDEAMKEERVSAAMERQKGREFQKMSPREALGRRLGEIDALADTMTSRDMNQETAMASEAIANSMRDLAQQIRESPIDDALNSLARKFGSGQISSRDFDLGMKFNQSARQGNVAAGQTIESAGFNARIGMSEDSARQQGELDALRARESLLVRITSSTKGLSSAEREKNQAELAVIQTEIKHKQSLHDLSLALDDYRAGRISESDYRFSTSQRESMKSGQERGAGVIADAEFNARRGMSSETLSISTEIDVLKGREAAIISLSSATANLTSTEREKNEAELAVIQTEIKHKQSLMDLSQAADDYRAGRISREDYTLSSSNREARTRGESSAQERIDAAAFSAANAGYDQGSIAKLTEIETLNARKVAIDNLLDSNNSLTADEKKRLEAERETIAVEEKHARSQQEIAELINKEEFALKKLVTQKNDFIVKRANGIALTRDEVKAERQLDNQINESSRKMQTYTNAVYGGNVALNKAANSSRRYNFMVQQASYGVQDFVQVIGQTGLSGALRASANNMASLAAATGTVGGAVTGALGTIAMIGMADAIKAWGWETESTTKKLERLQGVVERFANVRSKMMEFHGNLVRENLGLSGIAAAPGVEARNEAAKQAGESAEAERNLRTVVDEIVANAESSTVRAIARVLETNDRAVPGMIPVGTLVNPLVDLAAAKITGNATFGSMKEKAVQGSRQELEEMKLLRLAGVISPGEMAQATKTHEEFINSVNRIASMDVSDASQVADIAKIIDNSEELKKAVDAYVEASKLQIIAAKQSEQSLIRLGESLDKLEADVQAGSVFSDAPAEEAISGLMQELAKSASRIRMADASMEGTSGAHRANLETLRQAEADQYNKYLQTLGNLNNGLKNSTNPKTGIAGQLAEIAASIATGRMNLEKSLEFSDPVQKAAILADYDKRSSKKALEQVGSVATGFTGVERKFGETQLEANTRTKAEILANQAKRNPAEAAAMRPAIAEIFKKIDKSFADALREFSEARLSSVTQGILGDIEKGKARKKEHDLLVGPDAAFDQQNLDILRDDISRRAESFTGRADKLSGENQKQANDRLVAELNALIAQGFAGSASLAEMKDKIKEYEKKANDIEPNRRGISGTMTSIGEAYSERRKTHDKEFGFNATFSAKNIGKAMSDASDAIMNFSGKVERRLGETQEQANQRERIRLGDLIKEYQVTADKGDDKLIPYIKLMQRKIGQDEVDAQSRTATTPIESLNQKIQDSLTGVDKDFDLQVKQKDLLEDIKNALSSNVIITSTDSATKLNDEALVVHKKSSSTLEKILKAIENSGVGQLTIG
tara:strand:+ start:3833 stop:8533 length:4701 start_codon:yes stop_codon:yes gene_type:complete